jgi:hypothetical protein
MALVFMGLWQKLSILHEFATHKKTDQPWTDRYVLRINLFRVVWVTIITVIYAYEVWPTSDLRYC